MKLFKSLLIISAVSAGSIATAHHPLINELKCTVIENVNFFKQVNHSNEDIYCLITTHQTLKELIHNLSITRINRKELTLLVETQTYLQEIDSLVTRINEYIGSCNCQLNIDAQVIKPWIKENRKKLFSHINAFDLLFTQWSTLAL
ncbi:hypothetical protein Noda2021_09890 [Candidatus Dependentiae bacterium Noda2021]|nr:hypothetical protein Noda2021_09890 [Candidatus Dependentiae bacterium Noda2021]